jgi:hypothetical protein
MTLTEAIDVLRQDPDLAERFTTDPEGVLKGLGVSTQGLKIEKSAASTVAPPSTGKAPTQRGKITICATIGFGLCISAGGEAGVAAALPASSIGTPRPVSGIATGDPTAVTATANPERPLK